MELFYHKLYDYYVRYECNALWDLGDTSDERAAIPWPTLTVVRRGIKRFPVNPSNIKLVGNHEQFTRNVDFDNAELFNDRGRVVSGVETVELEGVAIVCAAYPSTAATDYRQQIESALLACRRKPTIVLGHMDLSGAVTRGGTLLQGLDKELFERAHFGLFGHIHKPQTMGHLYYVGSPFQQNFGESGEEKRLGLVTINGDEITLEWLPIDGFPIYREGTIDDFEAGFSQASEDRWKIYLKNESEASRFFAHPFAWRAVPEYDYHLQPPAPLVSVDGAPVELVSDFDKQLQRWMQFKAPSTAGITAGMEDLVDCAKALTA